MLDIDLKNPYDISMQLRKSDTGNKKQEMHLVPKMNRTQMYPAEMPLKLRVWHARRKRNHVHCVGGKLKMWPREFAWVSEILYNQEHFDPTREKKKAVHWRFVPRSLCEQLRRLRHSLTLPIRTFWAMKEKEKKQVTFLNINVVLFLCYTT